MLRNYFKNLYTRTMDEAYTLAQDAVKESMQKGGECLDCGAHNGFKQAALELNAESYHGIEWHSGAVDEAQQKGLDVIQGDLNRGLPYSDERFTCIFGLSVVEHLLNPCRFLRDAHRCLAPDGTLVILTPNISTLFTIALLLAGKMPSSGPHPDSEALLQQEEVFKVSSQGIHYDGESDTPVHRHLVVFSYRVLRSYLNMLGFSQVDGHGFGLYPFPNFMQKPLEKLDPYHCHQMVFIARK